MPKRKKTKKPKRTWKEIDIRDALRYAKQEIRLARRARTTEEKDFHLKAAQQHVRSLI